jgi:hypothetical protein
LQLSNANTITVSVNVVAKGIYKLYTNNNNGVYFLAYGTFTTTGLQQVVLTGNGTPVKAGNFPFVIATTNTCSFSVTFTSGGASVADFTYAGAPGNCTAPVVSGTYASGTALGASNYVDLTVNVTNPGTYTINTNSVNGMSFSASGVFNTIGINQMVRLNGSGTPTAAGPYTFTPANNGCSFSIAVVPPLPPATFTYNGAPGNCTGPIINGTYAAGTALNGSNTIILNVNVSVPGSYNVSTNSSNGVVFSASGVFAGMGANTITLTSTNTPGAGGTFSYTPSGGCSFDVTYTGGGGGGDFIKCTIDGAVTNFAVNPFGTDDNSSAPFIIGLDADLTSGGDNFAINITDENNPVVTGFDYSNRNLLAFPTKYCEISYSTGAGFPWGSSITNNSFIVRLTSLTATTVTGTFSGKVYADLGTGTAFKNITNGTFSITF